ncbi:MAG: YfdQ family protein [Oceanobacter sp.]
MSNEAESKKTNSFGIKDAIELGKNQVQLIDVDKMPVLVHPRDLEVNFHALERMDKYRETPRQIKNHVELHTSEAFINYVNDFCDEDSAIFVDQNEAKFVAILDFHRGTDSPRHGNHTATFKCQKTDEWDVWLKSNGKKMSQEEFALFIEDNADEIVHPVAAEMLEIALTIKANINCEFRQSHRLDNGQVQLTYNEVIDGRAGPSGQLEIPQEIKVGMQPFQGSDIYTRTARFRWRQHSGNLTLWYDLIRPKKCIEEAVKDTLNKIRDKDTGVKVTHFYFGEAPRGNY